LMSGVNLWSVDHLVYKFSLFETLVNEQVIFLMHSTMTTLTRSLEDLKSSSQSIEKL
jgi:hypothetical protein